MNKESLRQAGPLLLVFVLVTAICIAGKNWLEKNGISQELVIWGNIILAAVSLGAYYVNLRSVRSASPQAPVRGMYGGFMIKFFLLALAAIIYIMLTKKNVNKPGLLILAGLYVLYTAFETRALMQLARKKGMPKKEVPVDHLQHYLPEATSAPVLAYLHQYKVHLTVTRERKSILGDYRHRTHYENHRISVNGNLNKFSFLITLLHELAHLLTFEQHTNRVAAHGREWKTLYAQLLQQFLQHKVFPADIESELLRSLKNPAASSCAEDGLLRVLRKYDTQKEGHLLLEELPPGASFRIADGRVFQKGEKLRKRFKCTEIKTGKLYLFSPVYEVSSV